MISEEEFIKQARLDWEEDNISTLEDALEANYMNGNYDEIGGDVEAPTGHFYQIEHWTVVTDSDGNTFVNTWKSVEEAERHIEELQKDFDRWNEDN